HLRAGRGGLALSDHDVLDGDGHAGQTVDLLSGGAAGGDVPGGGERLVGGDVDGRAQGPVDGGDAVQVGAGELLGGALTGGARGGLGGGAGADDVGHAHPAPRTCGTAKRPSSAAGAPDSACSWVRVFSTTSSRKTLVMAMGWDVAGTSSV